MRETPQRGDRLVDRIGQFVTIPMSFLERQAEAGPNATALFCYLRRVTNWQTDVAMPAYEDIKAGTGIASLGEIAEAIRVLIGMGFLERRKRFSAPSEYRLLMPRPEARPETPPAAPEPEPAPKATSQIPMPEAAPAPRVRAGRAQAVPTLPPAKWEHPAVVQIKNQIMRRIPSELLDRIIEAADGKTPDQIRATLEACAMAYSGVRESTGWEWIDHLKNGTLPEPRTNRAGPRRTTTPAGSRQGHSVFLEHVSGSPTT